jgi:hypothetical protein
MSFFNFKTVYMKARIFYGVMLLTFSAVFFTACQKDQSGSSDYTTETSRHSDDQSRFSGEVDAVANDVNVTIESTAGFTGRTENVQSFICDASVAVDTLSNPRTITITYNGTNCLGNRTRSGVIVISMAQGVRWKNSGAVINVTYQNFKVTRLSDNKSITFNGTHNFTNVSGGILINLPVLNTIIHTITSSNMSVTFDDNSQRTWQVSRQRVYTYNNGVVITVTGMHSANGITGIAEWGTNRFGNAFTTAIAQPVVMKQDCGFRVGSGKVVHRTSLFNASVILGLDVNGNPTGCPGANPYYMKVEWTGPQGNTQSALLPY